MALCAAKATLSASTKAELLSHSRATISQIGYHDNDNSHDNDNIISNIKRNRNWLTESSAIRRKRAPFSPPPPPPPPLRPPPPLFFPPIIPGNLNGTYWYAAVRSPPHHHHTSTLPPSSSLSQDVSRRCLPFVSVHPTSIYTPPLFLFLNT